MLTEFKKAEDEESIEKAGTVLRNGGVVAIPTETVYGLAANAYNEKAIKNVFEAKGRPSDNPLIVHISEYSEWKALVKEIPSTAKKLAEAFWPGPLTIILPKSETVPDIVSAGLETVAVRCPENVYARKIIKAAGVPLAAPSANVSGLPSPTNAKDVFYEMQGKIDMVVDGGECNVGIESTVVIVNGENVKILRPGGITKEDIEKVVKKAEYDEAVFSKVNENSKVSSPGMKYKHYAPKAKVILVESDFEKYKEFLIRNIKDGTMAMCYNGEGKSLNVPYIEYGNEFDDKEKARKLFSSLRRFDEMGAKTVYVRTPEAKGVGLAVYNRLIRAAGFEVIKL